jgi:hypothetical protein
MQSRHDPNWKARNSPVSASYSAHAWLVGVLDMGDESSPPQQSKGELRVSGRGLKSCIAIGKAACLKIGRSWTGEEGTSRTHEKKPFAPGFSVSAAS